MPNGEIVNYLKKRAVKAFLHVFWVFPVDKKKVFLLNELSYTYGDNLKYIDIYIRAHNEKGLKPVFAIKDGYEGPADDLIVRPNSLRYFRELLTSGTVITNAGGVSYIPKRKKQRIISTWHGGGPYKKTSVDVYDNYWYRKEVQMNCDNTDFILSSCRIFTEFEARSMGYPPEKCIPAGLPRNDILFGDHEEIRQKVRKYYSIPEGKKFVLYAPTFRSSSEDSTSKKITNYIDIDIERTVNALKERFGSEWVFGIRLHPKLADVDMSGLNAVSCTAYPDMQELLCCADAVITDYSSLMWDYSFTFRPIFLYAPDIEQYEKERGFYMPASQWPYPIAHSNDEMCENILRFDEDLYKQRVKAHHLASGSYETGQACKTVTDLINT